MKLLYCTECNDIIKLRLRDTRHCACAKSTGTYLNEIVAEISGPCYALGVSNQSLRDALKLHKLSDDTPTPITAFLLRIIVPLFDAS